MGRAGWRRCAPTRCTGVRPDCDFFLWKITERYDDLGELGAALNATPLAGWLETPYSYLATTKASAVHERAPAAEGRAEGLAVPRRLPVREGAALVRAAARRTASARWTSTSASARRVPDDPQPHDVLVRDRRPGVHDRVRVRRAGRLHAPDADAARQRGEPLHRARHADLRRAADARSARRSTRSTARRARVRAPSSRRCAGRARRATSRSRQRPSTTRNATSVQAASRA